MLADTGCFLSELHPGCDSAPARAEALDPGMQLWTPLITMQMPDRLADNDAVALQCSDHPKNLFKTRLSSPDLL